MTNTWKQTTEGRYWDMLGVLPPAAQTGYGFLVGEAYSHRTCTISGRVVPTFTAFVEVSECFYEAVKPLTVLEFRTFKPSDILEG